MEGPNSDGDEFEADAVEPDLSVEEDLPSQIWVGILLISDATAHKIATKHGLHADEVRDEVQCVEGLEFAWDDDLERGLRALIWVRIRGRRVLVVLYPARSGEEDVWHLGTAHPD